MPVDKPFQCLVEDWGWGGGVGPTKQTSVIFFTAVDFATRFPKAVAFKRIDSERVE